MKPLILTIVLLFSVATAICQDSIGKFELGTTLLTINTNNASSFSIPSKPQFEIINGIFFRVSKKGQGLRFNINYSEVTLKSENNSNCWDCIEGNANHKNLIIGFGAQLSMIKKRDYLYAYLDLNYRNVFSSGYLSGGFGGYNDNFTKTSDGVETNLGLAFKIKIFKSVYLSPESGYSIYYASVNEKTTSLTFNTTNTTHSIIINANPFFKLHLTTKF